MNIGTQDVNVWQGRDGDLLGALVFLTPNEVQRLREQGYIKIERKE